MTTKPISAARQVISGVLLLIAVPFVALGLIDPLEGGLALLLVGTLYLAGFLLASRKPRKILWISYLVAIVVGATQLTLALVIRASTAPGSDPIIPLAMGNWVYRAAVVVLLAAAVITALDAFKKAR